ncbi:MAG: FumA C-terminus/TtdB family hydratase beta subunit [Thermoproteota archaeon]
MAEVHLRTPIKSEESKALRVGDIVYFSGEIVFCRDKAHERLRELSHLQLPIPLNIKGIPIYHAGPVVKRIADSWKIIAAGPTTSSRMEEHEAEIIRRYEPRIIIGKGGMGKRTLDALIKTGGAYAVFPGGAALLAASYMKEVLGVYWLDLGIPDALWHVAVEKFGPCVVTMDSTGRSLHEIIYSESLSRLDDLLSS